ncbi:MAG: tail fiber domain-containing protein, partial [Candidatus Paceibacterota bacterium]
FVGPSSGAGTTGNVGIGTTAPNGIFQITQGLTDLLVDDNTVDIGVKGAIGAWARAFRVVNTSGSNGQDGGAFGAFGTGVTTTHVYMSIPTSDITGFDSTKILALNNSGNVGIGTTGPGTKLDIISGTGAGLRIAQSESSGYAYVQLGQSATATNNWHFGSEGDGTLRFYGGNWGAGLGPYLTIKSDGNVGIGTTGPAASLDIYNDASKTGLKIRAGGQSGKPILDIGDSTGVVSLYMKESGNVGIGTTSPGHQLSLLNGTSGAFIHLGSTVQNVANTEVGGLIANSYSVDNVNASLAEINFLTGTYGSWGQIQFRTNHQDSTGYRAEVRMTIDQDGNVGIGTTPAARLHVGAGNVLVGNTYGLTGLRSDGYTANMVSISSDNDLYLGGGYVGNVHIGTGTSNDRMVILNAGNVGIGIVSPSYQLQLSTDSAAKPGTNAWTVASDARLKTDITPFTDGLSILAKINPVNYTYNGKGGMPAGLKGIGIIAQDMMQAASYTVSTYKAKLDPDDQSDTDIYNFNSSALTFVMINAIKEQQTQIEELKYTLNGFGLLNSTSTIDMAVFHAGGFGAMIQAALRSLGMALQDGVATLKEVAADVITSDFITSKKSITKQMCVTDSGNNDICLTGDQLKELVQRAGSSVTINQNYQAPVVPIENGTSTEAGQ